MKLLIWAGDSWANRGDAAVLAGMITACARVLPEAELTVASACPDRTRTAHGVQAVARFSPAFLLVLARCDLLVWGGGLLIQNHSSKAFLALQLTLLVLARLFRKRVVCFGQGVGPVHGWLSRLLLRRALSGLTLITLRDRASAERLASLYGVSPAGAADAGPPIGDPRGGRAPVVHVMADPAFCLPPVPDRCPALERLAIPEPYVAVALRYWGHYRSDWLPLSWRGSGPRPSGDLASAIAPALEALQARFRVHILFVPMCPGGDQQDERIADEVRNQLVGRDATSVLRDALPPVALKAVLGRAELVVAMRTHAALLAASAGTPVLSISYQGKGRALMEELNLAEWCVSWRDVTAPGLEQSLFGLWESRDAARDTLTQQIPLLEARAWRQVELLARVALSRPAPAPPAWHRRYRSTGRLDLLAQRRRDAALELLAPGNGESVLDLGCGPGAFAHGAAKAGARWIGLDVSPSLLRRANGRRILADLRRLPVRQARIHAVLAVGVLDYLPPEEFGPVLSQIAHTLPVNGRLVLTLNGRWSMGPAHRVLRRLRGLAPLYGHASVVGEAGRQAGLVIEETRCLAGGRLAPPTHLYLLRKVVPGTPRSGVNGDRMAAPRLP